LQKGLHHEQIWKRKKYEQVAKPKEEEEFSPLGLSLLEQFASGMSGLNPPSQWLCTCYMSGLHGWRWRSTLLALMTSRSSGTVTTWVTQSWMAIQSWLLLV